MDEAKIKPDRLKPVLLGLFIFIAVLCVPAQRAQQQTAPPPDTTLSDALAAACRQDSPAFGNSLTAENAAAFRALPGPQRTIFCPESLVENSGLPGSSSSTNRFIIAVRCESPSFTTEMRLGQPKV